MTAEEALAILDSLLAKTTLNDLQTQVFCQTWEGKSYSKIAASTRYDPNYIKDVGYKLWKLLSDVLGEKVTKSNIQTVLRRCAHQGSTLQSSSIPDLAVPQALEPGPGGWHLPNASSGCNQDWGEATDISTFVGRRSELSELRMWVLQDHCRLVTLLGMGGIGKTSLAVKLGHQVQDEFEFLIWRSLRNAPPLPTLLTNLLQFLCGQTETTLPDTAPELSSQLLECLRNYRCLVILDNVESILQGGGNAGSYRQGYTDYGDFLRSVGDTHHRSCLLLTSREKPREIGILEGQNLPIRTLQLPGLGATEGQAILQAKGFAGTEEKWQALIQHCDGNPLALKIVSTTIQDLFNYDIAEFLDQGTMIFGGLRSLLDQQFNRLAPVEQQIMYWLAINREPVSPASLRDDLVPAIPQARLLEALNSLLRRCLLEPNPAGLTQQSVVMEYVCDRFIDQICREIETENLCLFLTHALIKAQVPEYVRESQVRVILAPIAQRLIDTYGSLKDAEYQLYRLLLKLQEEHQGRPGYGGGNLLNLFRHLKVNLTGYDFSHLAVWQAYLQDVKLWEVDFSQADLSRSMFTEILGGILTVTFSPDGSLLATSDTHGDIRLWQIPSGKLLLTNKGHRGWVWSVAFHPNGQTLASGSFDRTLKLWDTQTGECLQTLIGHTNYVQSVVFSPKGQILASSSYDQTLRLWDTQTGECLRILKGEDNRAWCWWIAFSPDGQQLASGLLDHRIKLWDTQTGETLQTLAGHNHWVSCVAFAPPCPAGQAWRQDVSGPSSLLASGSYDQTIKLWDTQTGECLQTLTGHTQAVLSISFGFSAHPTPGDRELLLASSSIDQTVKLWDVSTGECLRTMSGHTNRVWSVAVAPSPLGQGSGPLLASGGDDHSLKLWNGSTGQCLKAIHGYTNSIFTIAYSPDGQLLASGGGDRIVRIWEVASGQCLTALSGHTSWVWSVAFSPNGQWVASGGGDRTIRLWEVSTGKCLAVLSGHTSWVWSVVFNPTGTLLLSSGEDHTIRRWDLQTYQCHQTLTGHQECVRSLAVSLNGELLISGSYDQTIRCWQLNTGECLQTLVGHAGATLTVAISPVGHCIASGGNDQVVKLWDLHTGECLKTLSGHTNRIWSLAFSGDGRYLASGSEDQTVRLWDLATGECLQVLEGHTNLVSTVLFTPQCFPLTPQVVGKVSPEGQLPGPAYHLASSSLDETIRFWDLETGQRLRTLRAIRPYEGMQIAGIKGLTDAQKATLKALGAVEDD